MQLTKPLIKLLITFIIFSSINSQLQAQSESQTLDVIVGYSQSGIGVNVNYNSFIDRDKFIQTGLYFSSGNIKVDDIAVPYDTFTFNAGFFQDIFSSRVSSLKCGIGGGGLLGSEIVNKGENELPNGIQLADRSKIIYGAYLSAEVELYLSNDFSFIAKANQYYHVNSDLGKLTPFFGGGLRYFIN